jgi:hypothetical protein
MTFKDSRRSNNPSLFPAGCISEGYLRTLLPERTNHIARIGRQSVSEPTFESGVDPTCRNLSERPAVAKSVKCGNLENVLDIGSCLDRILDKARPAKGMILIAVIARGTRDWVRGNEQILRSINGNHCASSGHIQNGRDRTRRAAKRDRCCTIQSDYHRTWRHCQ